MSDADYELIESFHIDDGSLDDVDPKIAFALGVEWAAARMIKSGQPFRMTIHKLNVSRICALVWGSGLEPTVQDIDGFWMELVADVPGRNLSE